MLGKHHVELNLLIVHIMEFLMKMVLIVVEEKTRLN